ncbi:MAG: hypothetical protein V1928_03715 [Parcubacteria group bacterium]
MLDFFTYPRLLAVVVVLLAAWIVIIFYRIIREQAVKKVDFYKANWKIVLFWLVLAALALGVMYLARHFDFSELARFLPAKK